MSAVHTLPPSPNLEHLRRQARDLQRDHRAALPSALERIRTHLPHFASASDLEIAAATFVRTAAQLVVAREYGFSTWPRLVAAVEATPSATHENPAKAAIDSGDSVALGKLLQEQPELRDASFEWTDRKNRPRSINPIRYAHARNQQGCIDTLVAAGASLEFLGEELWNNTWNANLPQVRRLLALGVRPSKYHLRAACGHVGPVRHELVNTLIEAGVEWQDGPLMDLHRGDLTSLDRRLRDDPTLVNADVEDVTVDGRLVCTLLHVAASRNDVEAIELLLRHDANVNARAPEAWHGMTPLFLTLVRGITPTPTQKACSEACRGAFEALLAAGADLALRAGCQVGHTKVHCTPLSYALNCHEAVQRGLPRGPASYADGTRQIERLRELGAPE